MSSIYRALFPEKFRLPIYRARKRALTSLQRSLIWAMDPSVMFMRSRLEKLRGAYAGQRCFIMGNGPSLNRMDLELLKDEIVWGSNRCYLLFDRISWRPKFYVAVDSVVVPDNAAEINALSQRLLVTNFYYPLMFRYNNVIKSRSNVYWYEQKPLDDTNLPYSMFSKNPAKIVYSVRTVTVAMLQLAVYFGFNPIYLIGCDTNYTIPDTVKCDGENELISTADDSNHFSPSYFGKDKKWHNPNVDLMIYHYEQAQKVCQELQVTVLNATVGGNLEVFQRVNYKELFE